MKNKTIWIVAVIFLVSIALTSCNASRGGENINDIRQEENHLTSGDKAEAPLFIVTQHQIIPKNQTGEDFGLGFSMDYFYHDFNSVYKKFTDAVRNKDVLAINELLDEKITVSFGGGEGKSDFYKYWKLDNNPEQSELWSVLEEIIDLGGVYSYDTYDIEPRGEAENRRFVAPYTFADFNLDGYECFIVIDKDVKVYEQPTISSKVIDYLNYNIIKRDGDISSFWEKTDQDLVKIKLLSGAEGYIQKKHLRSPIDYRFRFISHNGGEWKMDFLVVGD